MFFLERKEPVAMPNVLGNTSQPVRTYRYTDGKRYTPARSGGLWRRFSGTWTPRRTASHQIPRPRDKSAAKGACMKKPINDRCLMQVECE